MPHVKLDCQMLDSTTWADRPARELFITALLMGQPHVVDDPLKALEIQSLDETGFVVPSGCYGFVRAAAVGIMGRAKFKEAEYPEGYAALERLAAPEPESRNPDWEGRRMVRVAGGYIILNWEEFRKKDATAAARQEKYRAKQRELARAGKVTDSNGVTSRNITQGDVDVDVDVGTATDTALPVSLVPRANKPIVATNVMETLQQLTMLELKNERLLEAQAAALFAYWCYKTKRRSASTWYSMDRLNRLKRHIKQSGFSYCLYVCDGGVKHPHFQQEGKPKNWDLESFFPFNKQGRLEKCISASEFDKEPIHPWVKKHPELGGGHE